MALNDDARSPNSSLEVTGTDTPNSPPATRWTAAARLLTGLVRMRLNNSDNRLTIRTMASVDNAMLRANAVTGASASDLSIFAMITQSRPGSFSGA